jgi:hypothetical protein
MSQSILKPDQREHLLTLMEHRLHKLDDKALFELEWLTRDPQRLTAFVPTAKKTTIMTTSPISLQAPPIILHRPPKGTVSRRQLLAGLSAVATAGAVGGGAYAIGARGARQNAERYAELDEAVQTAISYLDPNVTTLAQQAQDIADAALALREVAIDCVDCYPAMRVALETWHTKTVEVQHDYEAMQLVEGGVKAMAELLSMLAALPKAAIRWLEAVTFELGDLDTFRSAFQAFSDLLTHLDPALHAADEAHDNLAPWFSGAPELDVKHRLLFPLQDEFCPRVCDLGMQCQQVQSDWQEKFVQPVNAIRQQGA